MDRVTARNFIAGYSLKSQPVPTPFWPDLDGQVSVRELSGSESFEYENSDKGDQAIGKVLVKTILLTESKSPIFNDTDFQWLVDTVGIAVLKPLFYKVVAMSNMLASQQEQILEDAKKN
jgi:hypothetical protein